VSSATETAVDRKATTNTSRWNGDARPALGERYGEQERKQHGDAREDDAQLVQQLDQLAIGPLLRRLVVGRPLVAHAIHAYPRTDRVKDPLQNRRTDAYMRFADRLDMAHRLLL
jgi:hypothetical protein